MDKENPFIAKTLADRERVSKLFFPPKPKDEEELIEFLRSSLYDAVPGALMHSIIEGVEQFLQSLEVDKDTANVIDNLVALQECLEAGEDWCSVAVVAGAIELLQSSRELTEDNYKAEYFKLRARCKEEGIEV